MTNYCAEIAALMLKARQTHLSATGTDRNERRRIEAIGADLSRQKRELQEQAAKEFAALNGWRHSERLFSIKTLIRGGTHPTRDEWPIYLDPHCLLDHPVYFRETQKPYRPVAVVGQPYSTTVEEGTKIALAYGLELHAPPNFTASWWYPGHARFFCLTRPGVEVHFLPDQLTFEMRKPDVDHTIVNAAGGAA